LSQKSPIWVKDVRQDERFASKDFVRDEEIRSTAVFPLRSRGETVGVMFFSYREQHDFTEEEQRLYPILTHIAAASINDALLLEDAQAQSDQAQKARNRFEMALDITSSVGAELDQEKLITSILQRLQKGELFPNTIPAILLYNRDTRRLEFTRSSFPFYFPEDPDHPLVISISVDEPSIASSVARMSLKSKHKEYLNVGNVQQNPRYKLIRHDTASQLSITLWSDERGLIGVLILESTQSNAFDPDKVELAFLVAKQIRLAIERSEQGSVRRRQGIMALRSEIVHNLRRTLHVLELACSWLSREDSMTEIGQEWIKAIADHADTLRDMQSLAINLPKLEIFDVMELLCEIEKWVEREAEWQEVTLQLDSQRSTIKAYGDRRLLRLSLQNIIRNAIEAMNSQGTIMLITRESRMKGIIEINIQDTGPGIPPKDRSKIGRDMWSSKDQHDGQGLVNVKIFMELMDGNMHLLPDKPGWGTCFLLTVPIGAK